MLNLIPAILLLLASGSFGPSSGRVVAKADLVAPNAFVRQLAQELERAGLCAARVALVMAQYEDRQDVKPAPVASRQAVPKLAEVFLEPQGFGDTDQPRDGPRA